MSILHTLIIKIPALYKSVTVVLTAGLVCTLATIAQPPTPNPEPMPQTTQGSIVRIAHFASKYVAPRTIDIWLPEGYSSKQRYDVLYMHDGQMLYDAATTWNKQAWNIDDTASALIQRGECRPFIIVGIWNSGRSRHAEYFPQKPFAMLTRAGQDTLRAQLRDAGRSENVFEPASDAYLRCIVEEIKPHIDSNFSVYSDREHTFIAGSSMGGLISLYAVCEYPEVFGGAACISTHWTGSFSDGNNPVPEVMLTYMKNHMPIAGTHRVYFDCGDQTLDALYPQFQRKADVIMAERGYTSSSWITKYYPGADHTEASWSKRLAAPLRFLLGH